MVIRAQIRDLRSSASRRSEARRVLQLLAAGKTATGQSAEVEIHDISTGGFLIQTKVSLSVGETIEVTLPRTGARQGEVVWSSGDFFGCRFVEPIPPASVSAALLKAALPHAASTLEQQSLDPAGFGERLAELRTRRRWTLDKLAERLNVSRQAVWYWETGQRLPRAEHFRKISEVFAVPEADLLPPASPPTGEHHASLVSRLKQLIAQQHGVPESSVRIIVEF